jgi:hypothetical protein
LSSMSTFVENENQKEWTYLRMAVQRRQFRSPIPFGKPSSLSNGESAEPSSGKEYQQFFNHPSFPAMRSPSVAKPQTAWQQPPLLRQQASLPKRKGQPKQQKRWKHWLLVLTLIVIIGGIFASQGNGEAGAWTADALRAVLGPTITAQIESWYLGITNTTRQVQYRLSNKQVAAPWAVGTVGPAPILSSQTKKTGVTSMPLPPMKPVISPTIHGEGIWTVQGMAPAPYNYLPLDAKAFFRPDPSYPYAIVTLLQFDTRFISLHLVAGTIEPGGPRGVRGPGVIPAVDQKGNVLLAAFNGGFKYADGQYGLMVNGTVYVPAQPGAATIAVTKEGKILLGAWDVDPRLNSNNPDLGAWRQNASLLINKGVINPLTQDGAAWGGTILNSAYTWRSGLGLTANGTLVYAAGDALTALTLGQALHAAGAMMAMQTDINPFWVRAFLYNHDLGKPLTITKLNPSMQGSGTEYLYGTERDFFYLTRVTRVLSPSPPHFSKEVPSQ